MKLYGVDFTSAPRRQKPITVAGGHLEGNMVHLESVESLVDWPAFEAFLARPGPWLATFDFTLGMPRQAMADLGWPLDWAELVRHCAALGKPAFRAALDTYRETRPAGQRYAHRAIDPISGSHSPVKLVNPPVGLMFLEGSPRLLAAGLELPGHGVAGIHNPPRIALEGYPGYLARRMVGRRSYKTDERANQTPARTAVRRELVDRAVAGDTTLGLALAGPAPLLDSLVEDPSGDRLDAALALLQAAAAWRDRDLNFGLPIVLDTLEGWIATVPAPT